MRLQFILLLLITTTIFEIRQKNLSTYSKIVRKKGEITLKWSQLVIETIKNDPRIYQIMLISNYENADNPRIIQDLQENIPILHFNDFYLNGEIHQFEKWYSLSNPRDTTLFILVEFPNKNNTQWTEEIMAFVKQLSTVRIRPKCLIVRYLDSNQTSNYDKFLLKMWRDLFLDVTILDVIRGRATIHRLNPFLNFYKAKSFSKKTPLFPNKLENLNGYPLKVGIMYRPPYVLLKRNSTKHPFDVSGPDAEVGKFFATIMNYRQSFLPSNAEDFGHYGCNISKLTGFNSAIQRNRLQLITITSTTSRSICKKELFENTIFALDHYVAIAPTLKSKNFSISIAEEVK
ncbi:uncharacterized protein LOC122511902 [Leptopilina heterotoma]|uniref:uncharacterized protein LOC122511902 n=1 Tax=Leptopilina heterotoma TaxID=63436 RepID=UPI001CA808A0|nr:uncharacterized protein LOC122511902 [Leptopilina heterotoma]